MGFFRKKSDDDAIKDAESSLIEKPVEIPEPGPTPEQIHGEMRLLCVFAQSLYLVHLLYTLRINLYLLVGPGSGISTGSARIQHL